MTDLIIAAGAVPWRRVTDGASGGTEASGVEILLVHRPKYDDWSLPKGKREPGEHILLTAVREVFEETGVRSGARPPAAVGGVRQWRLPQADRLLVDVQPR